MVSVSTLWSVWISSLIPAVLQLHVSTWTPWCCEHWRCQSLGCPLLRGWLNKRLSWNFSFCHSWLIFMVNYNRMARIYPVFGNMTAISEPPAVPELTETSLSHISWTAVWGGCWYKLFLLICQQIRQKNKCWRFMFLQNTEFQVYTVKMLSLWSGKFLAQK